MPTSPPPSDGVLRAEGPAYPPLAKLIATALVAGLAASALPVLQQGISEWDAGWKLTFGTGAAFVVFGYLMVLTSRTGVEGDRIYQTGLLGKQIRLREVTQVRLVRIPWLGSLIVPRLVARVGMMRTYRFPSADAEVIRLFELMAYGSGAGPATGTDPGAGSRPE